MRKILRNNLQKIQPELSQVSHSQPSAHESHSYMDLDIRKVSDSVFGPVLLAVLWGLSHFSSEMVSPKNGEWTRKNL